VNAHDLVRRWRRSAPRRWAVILLALAGAALAAGTWENGVFDYWDLEASYIHAPGVQFHRHDQAEVPWLHHPGQGWMISYDDSLSLTRKVELLRREGLAGAMVWELSGDREGVLLAAVAAALAAPSPGLPAPRLEIRLEGVDVVLEWDETPPAVCWHLEASSDGAAFTTVAEEARSGWREPRGAARRFYRVVALDN